MDPTTVEETKERKIIKIDKGQVREHLDKMVLSSVEETLNGFVGRRSGPALLYARPAATRAQRGSGGHPGRALRAQAAHQSRRGEAEGAEVAQAAVRDTDHRALSPP